MANFKRALHEYRPRKDSKSRLEDTFAGLIAVPDIPPPLRNVIIDGWEVDFYWPHVKLAVELDGRPYHTAVRDMEKDKFKDGKLLLKGIRTLRITDLRVTLDLAGILADVRGLLAT